MRSIVLETYNPYQFDVIPLEVLGNIYEQYLGYTIRLTEHQVKYELKPEVRKAGGVYYTPEYIVDYIVKNTVGKLLQELPPGKIKKLRILDPACGSGSFLIRAYEEMLSYYRNQKKQKKKTVEDQEKLDLKQEETASHLTIQEKSEILREHIFGVDIDEQAVEVTKLSLMLKMLGDEYGIIPGRAILPMLDRNIKCGNSLISGNTLELKEYFGEEWYKVKPFNWDEEFRKIMKEEGGFDVVIGNPPYVFGRDWKMLNISDAVKKYLGSTYKTSIYQLDMFSIFMERGFQLCRMSGVIGQIVPNVWLTNIYSSTLRKFILSHAKELCILTPPPNVFPGITVDTIVYTFQKASKSDKFFNIKSMRNGDVIEITTLTTEEYLNGQRPISTVINQDSINLVYRLKENYPELQMFTKITRGVHPYRIGGYGLSAFETGPQTERDIQERPYNSSFMREGYRPFIYGRDLSRFKPLKPTEFIKYGPWLAEPRDPEFFEGKRIYSRKILGERLIVTIETTNSIADQQVYITKPLIDAPNVSYLAGILGSKLIAFFIRIFYNELNDSFPQIKVGQLKSLPIRTINFSDQSERKLHDDLVALVDVMLDLNKKIQTAKGNEKEQIQRQIDQTDREIDEIVYELYGITEEERRIIEGKE